MDALARRCFERSAREVERRIQKKVAVARAKKDGYGWKVGCILPLVLMGSCVGAAVGGAVGFFVALIVLGGAWALIAAGTNESARSVAEARKSVAVGIKAYGDAEPWAVLRVHEFAVTEFRERIQIHRERTLGRGSEWGRARSELAQAADDAQRSAAYWRERLRGEPGSDLARTQSPIADRLEAKLAEALEKLDLRATALRKFYNDCDARLAVMDRCNRDLEESRRLEELSGRADVVIAQAEGMIQTIAQQFVAEARTIAEALGGVATVGIRSLAGEAPMDNIEYFADHIIESSDRERSAIEDLERQLSHVAR